MTPTNRIHLDKYAEAFAYYTPYQTATYCINKALYVIGKGVGDNHPRVEHIIEPSAGNGAFSNQITCTAYDIEPEHDTIIKQDFLTLDIEYLKGRLIIGNPPFGSKLALAQKFFKKSVEIADYIAFILPISQLDNTNSLFEFDLIHSEDLGIGEYSDRNLHCSFNIYRRPKAGLNKRPSNKLESLKFSRQDSKNYNDFEQDVRMCYWGAGAGKILKEGENYSAE